MPTWDGLGGLIRKAPLLRELRLLQRQLLPLGHGEEELFPLTPTLLGHGEVGEIKRKKPKDLDKS